MNLFHRQKLAFKKYLVVGGSNQCMLQKDNLTGVIERGLDCRGNECFENCEIIQVANQTGLKYHGGQKL